MKNTNKKYYIWGTDRDGWIVKDYLYNVVKVEGTENGKLVATVEETDRDGWATYEVVEHVWEEEA